MFICDERRMYRLIRSTLLQPIHGRHLPLVISPATWTDFVSNDVVRSRMYQPLAHS